MRLAEACGEWDVDGMLSRMSHEQWNEWLAKDLIEPIGSGPVTDVLAKIGQLISAFVGHPLTEREFLPWKPKPQNRLTPKQSAVAISNQIKIAAAANGGHRNTGH